MHDQGENFPEVIRHNKVETKTCRRSLCRQLNLIEIVKAISESAKANFHAESNRSIGFLTKDKESESVWTKLKFDSRLNSKEQAD